MKKRKCVKVPVVIQMESLECGAAALCMVMAYYKKWVPLSAVREMCGVSRDGSKAKNIMKAAKEYGLETKAFRCEIENLKADVTYPCIIHWNFNHFVVLCGFKGNKAIINDPAKGRYMVSAEELDKSFTGICLTFEHSEGFVASGKQKSILDYAIKRILKNKLAFFVIALTSAVTAVIGIAVAGFSNMFADILLVGKNTSLLYGFVYALGFMIVIKFIAEAIGECVSYKTRGKLEVVSNAGYMWHILRLPMEFFSQRMTGDLQDRKRNNQEIIYDFIMIFSPLIVQCGMMLFYLAVMISYSPVLSLVGVASVGINVLVSSALAKRRTDLARVFSRDEGNLNSATVSGIEMIETIKSNGSENGFFEKWAGYQAHVNKGNIAIDKLNANIGMIPDIIGTILNSFIFMGSVYLCMAGHWTIGMIAAFQVLLSGFLMPANEIIESSKEFMQMRADIERIDDIMEYPLEYKENNAVSTENAQKLSGNIEIKNVTFGYSKLEEPLIRDFSLSVKRGSRIAIVGSTGSGKSTVSKLISGLYKPWSGEILFDGKKKEEIDRSIFTGSLSVVDQDIILFEDTISNNIKMWDSTIEDFEMIMAARDAQIHETIVKRENGYQYKLSHGGADLSGGERQRLEIARVLAGDPSIVIMDEATSALDAITEYNVVNSICNRGITCIIIAHRLSTIKDADEIIVMDKGVIRERGTHKELLEKDGLYKNLIVNE